MNRSLESPLKYCKQPGCGNKTRNEKGYCDTHLIKNVTVESARAYNREKRKHPVDKKYDTARWRFNFRPKVLEQNFQCQKLIGFDQCTNLSTVVHHLISPRVRVDLMFTPSNVVALCSACHPGGECGTPEWVEGRDYVKTVYKLPTFNEGEQNV
ncbi:MAG: hypothetical protein ABSF15_24205 [Candidatus Sulfotelmatobacter sp.]|jgi:hypothetical protein